MAVLVRPYRAICAIREVLAAVTSRGSHGGRPAIAAAGMDIIVL